jgi:type II secretory pathway pseudopilin PulG
MRPQRRGFSLVEMLAVMVSVTIIIGLCVTSLQGLMQTDRSSRREGVERATLATLAATFRADVVGATGHEVAPSPFVAGLEKLTLARADGGSVAYAAAPGELVRTARDPGAEAPRVETFPLRRGVTPRLELFTFEGATLARLVPTPDPDGGDADLRIEAVLGRQASSGAGEATP